MNSNIKDEVRNKMYGKKISKSILIAQIVLFNDTHIKDL
jgi:hypothetical protein